MVTKKVSAEKTPKKTIAKRKTAPKKASLIERKISSMVDDTSADKPGQVAGGTRSSRKKGNFPWWGLIALLLVLIFSSILLFEYNKDFRSNFSNLLNSTGLFQMKTEASDVVKPVEAFVIKMNIVYNKDDAHQKQTIDQYLQNIEKNLQNTKVNAVWMDKNSAEGKALIAQLNAKYLPIFTTDATIKNHPQYSLFAPALKEVNGAFQFTSEGLEYLTVPAVGGARFIGATPAKAKVVIIEYASLTCHYCQGMQPILDKVIKAHSRNVSWVVKMFDRGSIDTVLEQATECAADQNKFRPMMDAMYAKQSDFFTATQDPKDPQTAVLNIVKDAAKQAGANGDKILACVKAGTYADKVAKSTAEGQAFGIIGTPSFFVNKQFLGGALEEAAFTKVVEDELKK
jgi:protein-disulfide isomerase